MEEMPKTTKLPKTIPTALLMEWAERNRLIYVKMVDEAREHGNAIEAAHYMGSIEMVQELIFILSKLRNKG